MCEGNYQDIINAARDGVALFVPPPGVERVIVPATGKVVEIEWPRTEPRRKKGQTDVFDAESFNTVIKPHLGQALVYIDRQPTQPAIVAILNGHTAGAPGFGDHRVNLVLRATPQWTKWRGIDGKFLDQTTFAEFVEDNIEDVAEPAGALLLEIARDLQITRATAFRSAQRNSSGAVHFTHTQDDTTKVGAGEISIPEVIALGVAPFQGIQPFRVPARLRYRLNDGKLTLGIKLQRIEDVVSQALDEVVGGIEFSEAVVRVEGVAPGVVSA